MKKPAIILIILLGALLCLSAGLAAFLSLRYADPGPKVVFLSPSTQGANIYADGVTTERDNMNALADLVEARLLSRGFIVYRNDPEKTYAEAVEDSNALSPSIHVALHTNAIDGENTGVRGCEAYIRGGSYPCLKLATCLYTAVSAVTPTDDRGVKYTATLYEATSTSSPSVLLEVDFHDIAEGAEFLTENRDKIADAVADGIVAYFESPVDLPLLLRAFVR
ncbi:MAG: N-acetylmuramoyl-L-alanine amidase [Clostridiaceae bacterium]|nr:N-acetylmuramoyl-L-alanine amidase [Clostridiaceae bacterium]